jgi:hypothetical protein
LYPRGFKQLGLASFVKLLFILFEVPEEEEEDGDSDGDGDDDLDGLVLICP